MSERHPTAQRLIATAMHLFAEEGVAAVPITRIEKEAGLAPGSGAFYKHFRSKAEVLDAAVADAAATSADGAQVFAALEGLALRDQARLIARGTWMVFDVHRDLFLVMVRERDQRPSTYTHEPSGWPGDGPAFVAAWLEAKVESAELAVRDPRATALALLDALTFFWLQRATESETPYGVDDERFLDAWVEMVAGLAP